MKQSILKKMIKDSVKEAIQEELKDILLEAIKSPKSPINESFIPPIEIGNKVNVTQPIPDLKNKYADIMGALDETRMSYTSNDIQQPLNTVGSDPVNGSLPQGDVSMEQIMGLMNN